VSREDDERTGRLDPRQVRVAHRPPSAPEMARVGHAARMTLPVSSPQEAALYDSVVVPRYSALFSRPMLDAIPNGTRGQVLDLGCGTGHPALDVLRRMADHGRVIAIDRDSGLIDLARRRAVEASGKRIFFKVESMDELSFGDEVFDLAVGNLIFGALDADASAVGEKTALGEIRRVLVPGGRALLSRPLAGTFEEVLDMLREVVLRRDLTAAQKRLDVLGSRHPTAEAWATQLSGVGFQDVQVDVVEHRLAFKNARELFADPLVRVVAMPEWRWIAGLEPGSETVLEDAERALDTYFAGGPLSLTVMAGSARAQKPA
jgi:ubiquinone/menaquinone biosynthesis C-methylase UbiE